MKTIALKGAGLSLEQVEVVALGAAKVRLAPASLPRLRGARGVVERALELDAPAYGINTGLGRLSDVRIPPGGIRDLQVNLVRSHACGVGAPLATAAVRAMLLLRANSLAKGYSGTIRLGSSAAWSK